MKTFERAYKDYLIENLKTYIDNYDVIVANDINHKPLEKNPTSVLALINTGVASRINTDIGDYTTLTFSINFMFDANNLQEILGDLHSFIYNHNAKYKTLTINNDTINYKPIFTNPYPQGALTEILSTNELNQKISLKIINLVLNVNVAYSKDIDIIPDTFKLKIGSTEYTLNGVVSYNFTSAPIYETVQYINDSFLTQHKKANNIVFEFKMIASITDDLHIALLNDFTSTTFISDKIITLKRNTEDEVSIKTIQVNLTWENGAKIITLTLSR